MALTVSTRAFEVERVLTSADSPALLPFTVSSSAGEVLEVSLSSSLGDQVVFQLHNENLQTDESLEDDPADWSGLYNELDLVEHVQLQPFEARELVLCFRPRPGGEFAPTETRQKRLAEELEAAEADVDFRTPRHHHSVTELTGTVFLDVQPRGAPASPKQGAGGVAQPARLEVPFVARLCRSVLKTDAQELIFENCIVHESTVKDFTIWNCSEVPLRFRVCTLKRQRRASELDFTNLESGMALGEAGETIFGYSHMRVRAFFTPREAGQHSLEIELTNLNDLRNCPTVGVHAVRGPSVAPRPATG